MFYMANKTACTEWFTFHSCRAYDHATESNDEQCEKYDVQQNQERQKVPKPPLACHTAASEIETLAIPSSLDGSEYSGMGKELGKKYLE